MIDAINQHAKVEVLQVPFHLRSIILPKKFPGLHLIYEELLHRKYARYTGCHSQGVWDYLELSNNGFYLSHCSHVPVSVDVLGHFKASMSSDAASLIINHFVIRDLASKHDQEYLWDFCIALGEFAAQHRESKLILDAIKQ